MAKRTIVTLPGDGIGEAVLNEAIRVLDAAGFNADWVHGDIGWEFWCKEGNPLPKRTIDLIKLHKIALFGAITSKPIDEAKAELSKDLHGKGLVYSITHENLGKHPLTDGCSDSQSEHRPVFHHHPVSQG